MTVPRAVGWLSQPHEQRAPGSAPASKWDDSAIPGEAPPDESGILPAFVEREPVAAVAGYFPELPPIPKSLGAQARVPDRTVRVVIMPIVARGGGIRCDDA